MNSMTICCHATLLCAMYFTTAVGAQQPSAVYDSNCALCHQKGGAGLSGQFPRLAGRAREISATSSGRRYLIEVVLFGMAGMVEVDRVPIVGVMPSFAALSDEDLVAVLNYVVYLEGPEKSKVGPVAVSMAEVSGVRSGPRMSPTQVHEIRKSVVASKTNK